MGQVLDHYSLSSLHHWDSGWIASVETTETMWMTCFRSRIGDALCKGFENLWVSRDGTALLVLDQVRDLQR